MENFDFDSFNKKLYHKPQENGEDWLSEEINQHLLDDVAIMNRVLDKQNFTDIKEQEFFRLKNKIGKKNFYIKITSIAASVLLVISIGLLILNKNEEIELPRVIAQQGDFKAELLLHDGNVVYLNTNREYEDNFISVSVLNDSVDGLVYNKSYNVEEELTTEIYHTLKVPVGGFYNLTLSDGSKVWLNSESELRFPIKFLSGSRNVYLKGEGYFDVAKDENNIFTVNLDDASIKVLGTKFNINTYGDDNILYTTLVEGKISFISDKINDEFILEPGMQSQMDFNTGLTNIVTVHASDYTSWKDGRFVFHSKMDLKMIMSQLKRWYNIEVIYQNPELQYYKFHGVINRDMDLDKVVEIISETTNINFNMQGNTVIVSKK